MILLIDNYDSFTWNFTSTSVNWGRKCWSGRNDD
ncbi:para-aminobenzoate synthase component II [Raoultella ornithinolytica]|nr:para-aminobenzoate synthase component II [Raoultella ornithinolytica]